MDSRPSFPLLYAVNGTYVGALFHGQCYSCKTQNIAKQYRSVAALQSRAKVHNLKFEASDQIRLAQLDEYC